jgi:hypothetical protein
MESSFRQFVCVTALGKITASVLMVVMLCSMLTKYGASARRVV